MANRPPTNTSNRPRRRENLPVRVPKTYRREKIKTKKENKLKTVFFIFLILIFIWPASFGVFYLGDKLYSWIDPTSFPHVDKKIENILKSYSYKSTAEEKGIALCEAMVNRLQIELDSTFGWTVNDLIFVPTSWLDNRKNRQKGVIFATRLLVNFFSTHFARYGGATPENEFLKKAREEYFVFAPDSWWFPSSEDQYTKGIKLIREYEKQLKEKKAVFHVRTDDLYDFFQFVISPDFLDQILGMLVEENEKVPFFNLDDRVYYSQGVILVLRDFITVLVHLYPQIKSKGATKDLNIVMRTMDKICSFDPLIVLRGAHDSIFADHRGKMARYFITLKERLIDIANSLNI